MTVPLLSSAETIAQLRDRIRRLEGARSKRAEGVFRSGCPELDRLLPEGGFPPGSLVEWLAESTGSGAETLALVVAREAAASGGVVVVMDRQEDFYPPAAAGLGIDLERTLVVRAVRLEDELWALDQVLRCPGVAAAWAAVERLDWRWFRRLQLAAEQGGGLGLLLRPARVRGQPSWSQVQLLVQPCHSAGPRRLRVEVTRCQGAPAGGSVEVEMDDVTGALRPVRGLSLSTPAGSLSFRDGRHETPALHLAAQLAHPTPRRRAVRA